MMLRWRTNPVIARRLAASAATAKGAMLRTEDVPGWLAGRRAASQFQVRPIPFGELDGWSFDPATGNLGHRTGRYFSVEGYHVTVSGGTSREWYQPILSQPEIAILGLLVKDFGGVPHVLMQAKMEPGNCNLIQLSPTVQATWSNYRKVHGGADVRYVEYFTGAPRGQVIADVLQSEQGSWFDRKLNRNMIVETSADVRVHDDFCWLTLGQIGELLHQDNMINMDARSALSCAPGVDSDPGAVNSDAEVMSWFTGVRCSYDVRAERVPLAAVPHWVTGDDAIRHEQGRYFSIVAVSVQASSREVTGWTQPLLEPAGTGIACFLTREFGGVAHYLVHARVEGGFLNAVEMGPTVQCTPGNYQHRPAAEHPPFLALALSAQPERIRFQAVLSEEGGRFRNAQSRYMIIEADDSQAPADPPPDYCWLTRDQLAAFTRQGRCVNVQARTLLTCLTLAGQHPVEHQQHHLDQWSTHAFPAR
jgi:dTDP-4-dehydro-6-deoxy-alpha-D-glucopyranose 2,3-dehydratase